MSRELLQQALDALKLHLTHHEHGCVYLNPVMYALESALAQPEHRFDTPESHIVKWSIPVDPNNFGEPVAQPEQDWDLLAATQESLREHMAKVKELESKLKEKNT